jgi:hypothetical protein
VAVNTLKDPTVGVGPLTATDRMVGAAAAVGVGVAGLDEGAHAHAYVAKLVAVKTAAIQRLIVPPGAACNGVTWSLRSSVCLLVQTYVQNSTTKPKRRPVPSADAQTPMECRMVSRCLGRGSRPCRN